MDKQNVSMYNKLIKIYRWVISLTGMFILGTTSLILVFFSFGLFRNIFARYVFKYGSQLMLKIHGYKYELPAINCFPKKQVMYIINHNSYLDLFLLSALGLVNLRYILSESTLKFIPFTLSAKALGTWYIPQKKHGKRRLQFFIKTSKLLKRTNYSIVASPEGVHEYVHGILPFNKGIFHMAMEAGIPIVPIYIHIPEDVNPYKGEYSKSGEIHLELLDEIDNSNWRLETIWDEIAKVRKVYIDKFNSLNNTNIK